MLALAAANNMWKDDVDERCGWKALPTNQGNGMLSYGYHAMLGLPRDMGMDGRPPCPTGERNAELHITCNAADDAMRMGPFQPTVIPPKT